MSCRGGGVGGAAGGDVALDGDGELSGRRGAPPRGLTVIAGIAEKLGRSPAQVVCGSGFAAVAARARRWLTAHRPSLTRPRNLGDVAALVRRPARLRAIPLEAIVGTVDPTADFDADFRPATDRVSSAGSASRAPTAPVGHLPPIAVLERPDGYYVLDGRHRVSGARALGQHHIDAWASPAPAGLALPV